MALLYDLPPDENRKGSSVINQVHLPSSGGEVNEMRLQMMMTTLMMVSSSRRGNNTTNKNRRKDNHLLSPDPTKSTAYANLGVLHSSAH